MEYCCVLIFLISFERLILFDKHFRFSDDNLGEEERKGLKENYAVYYDRVEKLKQILYARQQKNKENVKEKP